MTKARRPTHLREWREHRGLSLHRAAEAIGIAHTGLSRMERGIYPYTQDHLESLAELYDCDPAELLAQDPAQPSNLRRLIDQASEDQRGVIERVAEAVLDYKVQPGTEE